MCLYCRALIRLRILAYRCPKFKEPGTPPKGRVAPNGGPFKQNSALKFGVPVRQDLWQHQRTAV